ncbi:MAG TPA: serine/threonine-protein kinase [Steroidobacteraceae bacterium]|jgi:tetratricopeptide (TPR) repeat protein/tRNA A-37 threonylcarbamoyl transferase component Bud32
MTPERWIRVKEVFAAALEQEAARRASYVEQACSGDDELRTEVISLLEAHDTAGAFIEEEAAQRIGLASVAPRQDWIGRRLGPYRIVAEAGRGGMSQVFKAVRDDQQYEKQVAIKLLKPGLDTDSLLRRFKAERQILAQLSHPHIAHLLDGGATEEGAPYLVMEYIEGNPIDVYCEVRELGVNERLDLFRDLCSAVHYVHQHLMVHGDIKGANVFVTEQGVVKLLDFGIAKLLGPTPSAPREATGFLALTPEYASPEQVRGEPITTASDIYSLGVLLYRLLAGALPYEATGSTTWALAKQICEHDPKPPSITADEATTGYGRFAKVLRGDLDNIVLKALKKAPEERYASAEQFAEDLHHYLRGFPVAARPDTTGYRMRKFAQRHKAAAVAGALFVVALIAGIITTAWQAHRAGIQQLRAERHLNEVRELTSVYLAEVYDAVADLPGGTKARKLLVENSIKYLAGLEREAQDSPQLQRDLAVAYDRLADVQGDYIGANLGDTQGALESQRHALRLRRALVEHDPSLQARRELLRSCVKLSELLMGQSTVPEALTLGREGAEVGESLLQDKGASARDRRYAAAAFMNYGWAQGLAGDVEPGMKILEKARRLHEQLAAENPQDTDAQRSLVIVNGRMGDVYSEGVDQPAKALPYYERALQLVEPIAAANPDDAELQRAKAFTLSSIADLQNDLQRPREGLANYERALAIIEPLRNADPDDQLAPQAMILLLNGRGESHLLLGEHAAALHDFSEAERILRNGPPPQPTDIAEIRMLPGITYANLARAAATIAQQAATPKFQRANYVREASDWSRRALGNLEPLTQDALEGRHARQVIAEMHAATAPLLQECRRSGSGSADCR